MRGAVGLVLDVHELPEDADDLSARIERDCADLDGDPLAVVLHQHRLLVGRLDVPDDLLRKDTRARRVSSGATTE